MLNLTALSEEQLSEYLVDFDELTKEQRSLLLSAERAREFAYNPYSHFFVGAALASKNKGTVIGANFENASFGLTNCAERSAIFKANIEGIREFKGIAISTRGKSFDTELPSMPCGACRQVIYEVAHISGEDLYIVSANTRRNKIVRTTISKLLRAGFGPSDLGINLEKYREKSA